MIPACRVFVGVSETMSSRCVAGIVGWLPADHEIGEDIETLSDDDVLDQDGDDAVPRGRGLWVWEGTPVPDVHDDEEYDPERHGLLLSGGAWRRASLADLLDFAAGWPPGIGGGA